MPQGAAELHGIGVGRSVVVGRVLAMPEPLAEPVESRRGDASVGAENTAAENTAAEKAAFAAAVIAVADELRARADRADGAGRALIEAAIQMAQDPMLADDVDARIEAGASAEQAVFEG